MIYQILEMLKDSGELVIIHEKDGYEHVDYLLKFDSGYWVYNTNFQLFNVDRVTVYDSVLWAEIYLK